MATSGSVDFSVTRNDLIQYSLGHIGVLGEGESPSTAQITEGAWYLNALVKARMADGMPLWALKQAFILPTTDISYVTLGGTDNAVSSYVTTTLSADAASGASTITVTSATGIATTYAIGIVLDDSTVQWTTVNGAPSGTTVTLTTALTGNAGDGNKVFVYNTANRIVRPLRVISAYVKSTTTTNTTRFPLNIITKDQYFGLGNPTAASVPNQVYYDPQLGSGPLYIYPRFLGGDYVIEITYHRPFEDFDASTDTPDFPQEWYLSLMLDLAALQGAKYGVTLKERQALIVEAKMWRDLALENGTEEGSFFMQPDRVRNAN